MTQPKLLAGLYRWLDGSAQPATEHRPVPRADAAKPEAAPEPCMSEQMAGLAKVSVPAMTRVVKKAEAPIPDAPPANLIKPQIQIGTAAPKIPKLRDLAEPVSDAEQRLMDKQVRRFTGKGIPKQEAQALAERLLRRDQQDDDRRSCAECASFRSGVCIQGRQPFGGGGIEVLHRCAGFKLDGGNRD